MPTQEPDKSQEIFIDFYLGKVPNLSGVTFETILHYSDEELELYHNFIQWLFPMTKPSQMTSEPIRLNTAIIQAFQEDFKLQQQLLRALDLMLAHYGLKREKEKVLTAAHFEQQKQYLSGHNLAWIDRMLNSLMSLGNQKLAKALFQCLSHLSLGEDFTYSLENYWRHSVHV